MFPEDGELTRGIWDDWWSVKPEPICSGCVPDWIIIRCCCCCNCWMICRLCCAICSCCCMLPFDFECWIELRLPELKRWFEDLKVGEGKVVRNLVFKFKFESNLEFWSSIPRCMFIVNSCAWTLSLFWGRSRRMSDNREKSNQENRIWVFDTWLTRRSVNFQRRFYSHLLLMVLKAETSSFA